MAKYLSLAESQDLYREWQKSGKARIKERFVSSVLDYANRQAHRLSDGNSDLQEELQQAGAVGACIAFDKYDPDRGVKFVTHAVWWIRSEQHKVMRDYNLISGNHMANVERHGETMREVVYETEEIDEATYEIDFEDQLDKQREKEQLYAALLSDTLTEQESEIVFLRYLCARPMTVREVADKLKIGREKVRRIEKEALGKLEEELG